MIKLIPVEPIDSIEKSAYVTSKDLLCNKEEIKCK